MIGAENRLFELWRRDLPMQRFVRQNRIRNRFADYAIDVIATASQNWTTLPASISAVKERHLRARAMDVIDPITSITWRLLMQGQMKQGELIESMLRKEAQRRLFTIKIKITMATAKAGDTDVEALLKSASVELRSPFDGSAFKWMSAKRAVVGAIPGRTDLAGVRL